MGYGCSIASLVLDIHKNIFDLRPYSWPCGGFGSKSSLPEGHDSERSCEDHPDVQLWSVSTEELPRNTFHCLILGFATEYSTSVRKFTATYVNPIARMQPCTRK
jgi:hypothetical protein